MRFGAETDDPVHRIDGGFLAFPRSTRSRQGHPDQRKHRIAERGTRWSSTIRQADHAQTDPSIADHGEASRRLAPFIEADTRPTQRCLFRAEDWSGALA